MKSLKELFSNITSTLSGLFKLPEFNFSKTLNSIKGFVKLPNIHFSKILESIKGLFKFDFTFGKDKCHQTAEGMDHTAPKPKSNPSFGGTHENGKADRPYCGR